MNPKLMAHLVAGYPDLESSFQTAKALVDAGCAYLEVQFPFSDPSADGPAIQAACTQALEAGFKINQGWALVDRLRAYAPQVPLFIMSYASIVVTQGVEAFVKKSLAHGVSGLIIPDLVLGDDEGLYNYGKTLGLDIIPVVVPTVTPQRLGAILDQNPRYVYCAIRTGITGTHTHLTEDLIAFLQTLQTRTQVLAGFGIDSPSQVTALAPRVHSLVVGSAFVREVTKAAASGPKAIYAAVFGKAKELLKA